MDKEKNEIRKAIDGIEPGDGARERMLAEIKVKAKAEIRRKRIKRLQYIRIASAAACLCLVLLGAQKIWGIFGHDASGTDDITSDDPPLLVGNPFEYYDSANELAEKTGVTIALPLGAESVAYYAFDGSIACADFTLGGKKYNIKASDKGGDFSGVSGVELSQELIESRVSAVLAGFRDEAGGEFYRASWTDGRITYYLTGGADATGDEVRAAALAVIALCNN